MSKKERLTDDELLAQFEGIGDDGAAKTGSNPSTEGQQSDGDLLEELGLPERPKSSGRHTPRLNSPSGTPATRHSPKRSGTGTPPSNDGAGSSEEKMRMRKSGESTRSFHNSFTPAITEEAEPEPAKSVSANPEVPSSGGGWWSTITSTASAAVKQAEALAKEIQQNEEAQRWAEQVKGNVGTLRGIGIVLLRSGDPHNHILVANILRRWRTSLSRTPDLYQYPPYSGPTNLFSREAPDTYHS